MPSSSSSFCVELQFENRCPKFVSKQFGSNDEFKGWIKNVDDLKSRVRGERGKDVVKEKRNWTHRIVIIIRCPTEERKRSLEFVDCRLSASNINIYSNTLCGHLSGNTFENLGCPYSWSRYDCETCDAIILQAAEFGQPDPTSNKPPMWQTAVFKQHRLSSSIIRCSDTRFQSWLKSFAPLTDYANDYRMLLFSAVESSIEKLLSAVSSAQHLIEERNPGESEPDIFEQLEGYAALKRQCISYRSTLMWLRDLYILESSVPHMNYDSAPVFRKRLLFKIPNLVATLDYAMHEIDYLERHACVKSSLATPTTQEEKPSECENCKQMKQIAYIAFGLIPFTIVATVLGACFVLQSASLQATSSWAMKLCMVALTAYFGLCYYLSDTVVSTTSIQSIIVQCVSDARFTLVTGLEHALEYLRQPSGIDPGRPKSSDLHEPN